MPQPESNADLIVRIESKHPGLSVDLVDAASRGMTVLTNYSRGLERLAEQLIPGEQVLALAQGELVRRGRDAQGVVAVSQTRVIAAGWVPGAVGTYAAETIEVRDITNVTLTAKALFSELRFHTAGREVVIKRCPDEAAEWVAETVRDRLAERPAHDEARAHAKQIVPDATSQSVHADPQESELGDQFPVVPRGAPRGADVPPAVGITEEAVLRRQRKIVIAVVVVAILALAIWLGSGSGSVVNDEGSYEWCTQRGLNRANCDVVNELADQLGEPPSDVLHFLNNSLGPID